MLELKGGVMIAWLLLGAGMTDKGGIKSASYWMVEESQCRTGLKYMAAKHPEIHWDCYRVNVKPYFGRNGRVHEPTTRGD